jgi:hypothetical protein
LKKYFYFSLRERFRSSCRSQFLQTIKFLVFCVVIFVFLDPDPEQVRIRLYNAAFMSLYFCICKNFWDKKLKNIASFVSVKDFQAPVEASSSSKRTSRSLNNQISDFFTDRIPQRTRSLLFSSVTLKKPTK